MSSNRREFKRSALVRILKVRMHWSKKTSSEESPRGFKFDADFHREIVGVSMKSFYFVNFKIAQFQTSTRTSNKCSMATISERFRKEECRLSTVQTTD